MIHAIRRGIADAVDFLLPRLCCGCGERVFDRFQLVCPACLKRIPPLLEPICVRCGCPDARITGPDKCANCPPGTIWFNRARGVVRFGGIAQTMVHRLKYQTRMEFADMLGRAMLAAYCRDGDSARADVVVPVPLFSARKRHRGFNQSDLLAKFMARALGIPFAPRALKRTRPTVTQTRLKKGQRRQNVEGAFECRRKQDIAGKRVLLIDDVYTTGSTINECARVLKLAGAVSVECLAYARAVLK